MKKTKLFTAIMSAGLLTGSIGFTSCEDEEGNSLLSNIVSVLFGGNEYAQNSGDNYFGWFGQDEDTEHQAQDILLSTTKTEKTLSSQNLPSKVDLTDNLPPIGNQGQYGTCVAWAVAYNCRTFLYSKQKGLSKSALKNASNQFSPKDLFWSIDDSYKGSGCNGTNFEYAFDVMISRGVATQSDVPYTNLGNCTKNTSAGSATAGNYKIKSFRQIKVDKQTIKEYLANGQLVVFGAQLGDEFMNANSSSVLYSQTYGYTGQHAYHAMVCSGYDDTKGSNGAFRVVNSWGENWGDDGYIWVDQNFFVGGGFAYCAYVAYNLNDTEVNDETNTVDDNSKASGDDLVAYSLNDNDATVSNLDGYGLSQSEKEEIASDPTWRQSVYNVYNAGETAISASNNWAICLLYYNAYNANDYGIILLDYYTDQIGNNNEYNSDWKDNPAPASYLGVSAQGYSWNHFDIPSGYSVAQCVNSSQKEFTWSYKMPSITGDYYLILFADAFDGIDESNEDNNYCYWGDKDGNPIHYTSGVPSTNSISKIKAGTNLQSVVTSANVNAYSTDEIAAMIRAHKKSGELSKKAAAWKAGRTVLPKK
ncbi:MAG: C1 family peptidase [Bacteroidales bacterium]|nr:C1 family peptidase [Bacteroidales bacterium]